MMEFWTPNENGAANFGQENLNMKLCSILTHKYKDGRDGDWIMVGVDDGDVGQCTGIMFMSQLMIMTLMMVMLVVVMMV